MSTLLQSTSALKYDDIVLLFTRDIQMEITNKMRFSAMHVSASFVSQSIMFI